MNKWDIKIIKKAYKQLKKLPQAIQEIADIALLDLEKEGPQPKHWDIKKTAENEYRLRINYRYRMRYVVKETELLIELFYIGHRKDAYK